jgi:hypothetical protein
MRTRITLFAGLVAATLLGGCASHQPASAIHKVQMFHLKSELLPMTQDQMIRSETQKRMWGAISWSERHARLGNYYLVHWGAGDGSPATVRFEYRQAKTGSKLFKQEVEVAAPARKNSTEFQVIGPAYESQGRVVAWRIQVIQGGQVVGEETSFLWN